MIRIALLMILALTALPALGWNDVGHMAVAAIAYDKLSPETRARVKELLKLNPDHASWIAAAGINDPDKVAFMRSAYWPDDIKFKGDYKDDKQTSPNAAEVIGYVDKARHKYWHYKDIPFTTDGTGLPKHSKTPNAQGQIATMRELLSSDASDDVKSYSLGWVNHLVGDVHQPLHASARFSKELPRGDGGGNDVTVCASECGTLHAFWDDAVGATRTKEDPIPKALKVQQRLASFQVDPKQAAKSNESVWISESSGLARKYAYAKPVGTGTGSFKLDQIYRTNAGSIAEKRIAVAGVRLANLINDSLK